MREEESLKKSKLYLIPVLAVMFTFLFVVSFTLTDNPQEIVGEDQESNAQDYEWHSLVRVEVVRDGEVIQKTGSHNLVTDAGLNSVRDLLTGNAGTAWTNVALCNSTSGTSQTPCATPASGDTSLDNEYDNGGLNRTTCTQTEPSGTANVSCSVTFTATKNSLETNKTGLYNSSALTDPTLVASNTFTEVTLQTDDQLTINWSIWPSSA